jgi:aconitate hydratase
MEAISEFVFSRIDPHFSRRSRELGNVMVVGGENYGQGSSRERAAIAPRYLGVRVKLAKSFAGIHHANLCNFGAVPLTFADPENYAALRQGVQFTLSDLRDRVERGDTEVPLLVDERAVSTRPHVSDRQRRALVAGGR